MIELGGRIGFAVTYVTVAEGVGSKCLARKTQIVAYHSYLGAEGRTCKWLLQSEPEI